MARSFLRLQKFDLNRVNLLEFTEIQGKRVRVKWIPLYVHVHVHVCVHHPQTAWNLGDHNHKQHSYVHVHIHVRVRLQSNLLMWTL